MATSGIMPWRGLEIVFGKEWNFRRAGNTMIAAAICAGLVALLTYGLPFKLGLIIAALTGIVVGTILEDRK